MDVEQYQIVLINLDPSVGSEIKKTRLCVIISPNEMNRYLNTLIIAPMTSQSKKYPTRVEVKHDGSIGWVVLDQIRTVDKQRIVKTFGTLTANEIVQVKLTIKEMLVD
jgi:mRNA interferase MazF